MKATVVGLGLIGGSLAKDLKARGFLTHVTGVDQSSEHRRKALELGLVDEVADLEEAVSHADLVVLAIPVDVATRLLPAILDRVPDQTTVTDMGSTKAAICQAVESHPKRAQFVPSHPMAGTENSGPTAAIGDLFDGATAVICDPERSGARHLERIRRMYEVLGMRLTAMTSAEHDLHTAYVSHLSHVCSFVLANTVLHKEKNVRTIFDLAGGGFESTVRLAKSSPEMWAPIFDQNRSNVISALRDYIDQLTRFRESLEQWDVTKLSVMMKEANQIRRVLDKPVRSRDQRREEGDES